MSNRKKNMAGFCGVLLFSAVWSGCLKDISDKLPEGEHKITVNGFITPGRPPEAFITRSRGTTESVADDYLNDAKAYIYEDDVPVDSLKGMFSYVHLSEQLFIPQIGKTYRIEVFASGFPSVKASTAIPDYVPIQSVGLDTVFYPPAGHDTYVLRIKINDPPLPGDHYHLLATRLRLRPDGSWDMEPLCYESDDPAFESLSKEKCMGGLFSDAGFNGQVKEIAINTKRRLNPALNDSVRFVVELRHGSESYFNYNKSLIIFKNNQWDIFAQPAGVTGNIENGYGIFAGYAPVADTVKLD